MAAASTKILRGVYPRRKPRGEARPSALMLEDTAGNAWYLWFDTSGNLRTTDAATFEADGFALNSGGTVVGSQSA
jgi:hypothetical protein